MKKMCTKNHNDMMNGYWDTEWDTKSFAILGHFLLFYLPPFNNPKYKVGQTEIFAILSFQPFDKLKNHNFNIEKNTWRYYHFTYLHHKRQSYDVWFLRSGAWRTEFFAILDHFFHFYPLNNPKNQNFRKIKKPRGVIIALHMCTINENHMMYGCWVMERVMERIFFKFWTVFSPFLFLFFLLIGIHSMPGWTATTKHGVTRKRNTKRLSHKGNLSRKKLQ